MSMGHFDDSSIGSVCIENGKVADMNFPPLKIEPELGFVVLVDESDIEGPPNPGESIS